jgi:hypothetical protein
MVERALPVMVRSLTDRGQKVDVAAGPHSWSGNTGYGARLQGMFAGTPVDITADIPPNPDEPGSVTGSVGGKKLDLHINEGDHGGPFPKTRLTGTVNGPIELLALVVGAVAFFAP